MNPPSSSQEENQQVSCGDTGITDTETAVYLNCQEIEEVNWINTTEPILIPANASQY